MAKKLKILSINFPFRAPWVVREPTLATQRALFDFDVVVIRPYLLLGVRAGGPYEIEGDLKMLASWTNLGLRIPLAASGLRDVFFPRGDGPFFAAISAYPAVS